MDANQLSTQVVSGSRRVSLDPERWLAAIVDSSDDAIVGESLDGIIMAWNAGAERMFGYTAEEAVGKPVQYLAWPGLEEQSEILLRTIRSGERIEHHETLRRHKNGRKIFVSLNLWPIFGPDGEVIGIAKIARDMTQSKLMQESLRQRADQVRRLTEREAQAHAEFLVERSFRELIEKAPDAILQVDQNGTILVANGTAETMFGYSREELLGSGVDMLVPDTVRAAHVEHRRSFGKAGVSRAMGQGLNLYARRKDGTEIPVEISLSSTNAESGVYVTAVIRDITERKRAEQQIRTLQESYMAELVGRQQEAARLSRLKSEFLAGITHEFRTPLHTIIGFADLLNEEFEGPLNDAQRRFLQHIRKDSQHLLALINDLLDISRIEAGGLQIRTKPLALRDAIFDAARAIQPHAEAKGITIGVADPGEAMVMADPIRLRQILYNLLTNAVNFTPSSGQVSVAAAGEDDSAIRVTVTDSGVGIAPDQQSRIFDMFYQVGDAEGGAGLGLAICKQLVEMQGGAISVESEVGRGARFHFTLKRSSLGD